MLKDFFKMKYKYLERAEHLTPIEEDIYISEKNWMFKCRIKDIEIISDRKWNKDKDPCVHCPGKQLYPNHLLNYQYLIGKNQISSYIPDYMDIFNGTIEEQIYKSRILKENLTILKAQQNTM